ncbi:MAG: exo-beta-N-acetylmuramidase NamZ family protein [Chlamydiota bacterium]
MRYFFSFSFIMILSCKLLAGQVTPGIEVLFDDHLELLKGQRVALITNQTGVDSHLTSTIDIVKAHNDNYKLIALFAPEHGLKGLGHAAEKIRNSLSTSGLPIYSLHGNTRRPTAKMLEGIDLIIYDIQDIGTRSYTFISTLFYLMEEAAKRNITIVVADRPNPINGVVVDGPMLEEKWRSFVGYIDVPYCHGMTVGELAHYFNAEYHIGCQLVVIPMKGWKRTMTFSDTGLIWVPTSPQIPKSDTPLYYPMTGILGELQIVNIGVGYTLPFNLVGAPWIDAKLYAKHLNEQNFPGVTFQPFHFKPFYGRYKGENCHGIRVIVTDHLTFKPVATQYLLLGILKSLYPQRFKKALQASANRVTMFNKVNGTEQVYNIMTNEKYIVWKLRQIDHKSRQNFVEKRKLYLLY